MYETLGLDNIRDSRHGGEKWIAGLHVDGYGEKADGSAVVLEYFGVSHYKDITSRVANK